MNNKDHLVGQLTNDTLDSIAVSVFVVILVDFDKYWDDDQNIVAPAHEDL